MYEALGKCPVCQQNLEITRLYCEHCRTTIEGRFTLCKFCRLTNEQKQFVETFIRCRGNIKEMEKELGISYPTVRSKLDEAIQALGHPVNMAKNHERKKEILEMLSSGEITHNEALKLLKEE